jgi:tetratricopeptide (TPR) repeat protein
VEDAWARLDAAAGQNIALRRYSDAAAQLRQAIALRPDHADGWFNLGYVLRQSRAYPEALEAYAEALRLGVSGPEEAHVNRAIILSEYLEQTGAAGHELDEAITKNPGFLPAWLNLGGLMEDVGDARAAGEAYTHALRLAPGNGRARARLSAIAIHKGEIEDAIRDLEDQLRRGADSQDDRAELLFALGNALDAAGRYREAFSAIDEANGINRTLRPASQHYNRQAQERLVDALIAAFPARPDHAAGPDDHRLLFVCGMFRSGSTVIEQLLGRHPLVEIGGELELVPALVHEHLLPYPASLAKLGADDIRGLGDRYLRTIGSNFPSAAHVTDKRPDNFLHIGLIKTLFPGARIIHTARGLLDNILSIYFLNFAEAINYSDRIEDIIHYVGQYRRLMAHWQAIFGEDIVTVEYDALVRAPEAVMTTTFDRLGLPVVDSAEASDKAAPVIRTPSNWKARSALHSQSSGRWRNYAAELAGARAVFGDPDAL